MSHMTTTVIGPSQYSWTAWSKAEQLARRVYHLTTVPMRSENHPTWDPQWRTAMEEAFLAIGSGDEQRMDRALTRLNQLSSSL